MVTLIPKQTWMNWVEHNVLLSPFMWRLVNISPEHTYISCCICLVLEKGKGFFWGGCLFLFLFCFLSLPYNILVNAHSIIKLSYFLILLIMGILDWQNTCSFILCVYVGVLCVYMCICVCTYVRAYMCFCVCIHVNLYVCLCVCSKYSVFRYFMCDFCFVFLFFVFVF